MVYTLRMDALHISGKWYISSRRAAKEHGYHADYIGQLIRTGKVKGQKVGRAWYVLADSLADYFEKEGSAPASASSGRAKSSGRTAAKIKTPVARDVPEVLAKKEEKKEEPEPEEEKEDQIVETDTPVESVSEEALESQSKESAEKKVPEKAPEPVAESDTSAQAHNLLTYLHDEDSELPAITVMPAAPPPEKREEETRIPIHAAVTRFNAATILPLRQAVRPPPSPAKAEYRRLNAPPEPSRTARGGRGMPKWLLLLLAGGLSFAGTFGLSLAITSLISF